MKGPPGIVLPALIIFIMVLSACTPLQKARIRQSVTLDTHIERDLYLDP